MPAYLLNVKMHCEGCSGAVTRVLTKAKNEGLVSSFEVNLETQFVNVTGAIEEKDLKAKIGKTGKEIISIKTLEDSEVPAAG